MVDWLGLDSGGTEQLWEPEVLMSMLGVVKSLEPFSRGEVNSPIFDELEQLYPSITWRKYRADGTFNPIFRRSNPLVKLGLTTPETTDAIVTEMGNDVLSGNIDLKHVYALAARSHKDEVGAYSMGKMCEAALEAPNTAFTDADIEFGISKSYEPNEKNLGSVLQDIGAKRPVITTTTRKRRIRSFMNVLVYSGAFVETEIGWRLANPDIASFIANAKSTLDAETLEKVTRRANTRVRRKNFRSVKTTNRPVYSFDLSSVGQSDPIKAAIALERASQEHEEIVCALGAELKGWGFNPQEDQDSFDVALLKEPSSLFEVKTINDKNVVSQLRKAIIQLEEYRWRHSAKFETSPKLFAVVSRDPTDFLNEEYFNFVEADRGVTVIWRLEQFRDRRGNLLQDTLTRP